MKWGEIPEAEQKKQAQQTLRRAVETYHRDWRLLQEPLQNAIDSFINQETGKAIDFGPDHEPTVSITFDIDDDFVTVQDNGSGIKKTDHRYLIDPYKGGKEIRGAGSENDNETEKRKRSNLKGNQGIGAKTVVFGSSFFEIQTKHMDEAEGWTWQGEDLFKVPLEGTPEELEDIAEWSDENYSHGTVVKIRSAPEMDGFSTKDFIEEKIIMWTKDLGLNLRKERTVYGKLTLAKAENDKHLRKKKSLQNRVASKWREFKKEYGSSFDLKRNSKVEDIKDDVAAMALWDTKIGDTNQEIELKDTEIEKSNSQLEELKKQLEEVHKELINESKIEDERGILIKGKLERFNQLKTNFENETDDEKKAEKKKLYLEAEGDFFDNQNRIGDYKFYPDKKSDEHSFLADLGQIIRHYLLFKTYAGDLIRVLQQSTTELPPVIIKLKILGKDTNFEGIKPIPEEGIERDLKVGYETVNTAWNRWAGDDIEPGDKWRLNNRTSLVTKNTIANDSWKAIVISNNDKFRGQFFEHIFLQDELKELLGNFKQETVGDDKKLVYHPPESEKLKPTRYGYGSALKRINGIYVAIANSKHMKGKLGIPPGQWLSVNGLPTDIKAEITGVGNRGFLTSMHIVVDVDATLGIGKRNLGGEGPGLIGSLKANIENYLVGIWPILVDIARRFTDNEEKETKSSDIQFTPRQLDEITTDSEYEVMKTEFGRLTYPTTEDDIIQMHNYWLGKNNIELDWYAVSGSTEIDGLTKGPNLDGDLNSKLRIEYKGPDEPGSNKSGIRNLVSKNMEKGGKQSFAKYDVAIVWEPPTSSKIDAEDKGCSFHTFSDRETSDIYPKNEDAFPTHAMFKLKRDNNSICILSLKMIFDHYVSEYKKESGSE